MQQLVKCRGGGGGETSLSTIFGLHIGKVLVHGNAGISRR